MKKLLKIMACAMMVIAMAGVMSSCSNYDIQVIYSAGVSSISGSDSDLSVANNYVKSKGAVVGNKVYTVNSKKSKDDCYKQADEMAKSDYENSIRDFNVEEAQALLQPGFSFKYSWTRNEDGNAVVIGQWECPAKPVPVPTEFGKLTVNDVDYIVTGAVKADSQLLGTPATSMSLIVDDDVDVIIIISGLEQAGIVPSGDFNIDDKHNKFVVGINNKDYHAKGTSCSISKNGDYYKFISSGTGTDENGNSITYSLNCDKVVFTN